MKMKFAYLVTAIACFTLFLACTKNKKTTSCTSEIHAFKAPALSLDTTVNLATVDLPTMSGTTIGSFNNSSYTNQATFNTADNCYYVFKIRSSGGTSTLYRINTAGTVTTYTRTDTTDLEALVYNSVANKLYCVKAGASTQVVELAISGSTFNYTAVATTSGTGASSSLATSAVNSTTGEMYFTLTQHTTSGTNYTIEKFMPGGGSTSVISSGTGSKYYLGLRFNINDNMLYALEEDHGTGTTVTKFIKISPSSGTISSLSTFAWPVNVEFYSSVLDPCSNRYILTTPSGSGWTTLKLAQLDMSGNLVDSAVTTEVYQGLTVHQ